MLIWTTIMLAFTVLWIGLWTRHVRPKWIAFPQHKIAGASYPESVSMIVPARNEDRHVGALLESLADQGPPNMEIIVVDDHSTDGTAACVRAAMKKDSRIRLMAAPDKPELWAGKCWALTQGTAEATGQWLILCDADVVCEPNTIEQAFATMQDEQLDCLSLMPRMENHSLPTASLLAGYAVARALVFNPAGPHRRGLIQGAFLVVRRSAYEAVGGHKRLKRSLLEDVELGHAFQEAGFRIRMLPAHNLLKTRMYESYAETWEGTKKHLFPVFAFSCAKVFTAGGFLVAILMFPTLSLALSCLTICVGNATLPEFLALGAGVLCAGTMGAVVWQITGRESLPVAARLLAPISFLLLLVVLVQSIHGYRKKSIVWKGRSYSAEHFGAPNMASTPKCRLDE